MDSTDTLPSDTLQLNSEQLEVIANPFLDHESGTTEVQIIVYGRLLAGKAVNKMGLKNLFDSLWQNKISVQIEDYTDGIITIKFETETGKNRILKGQPWHFAGSYLILPEVEATIQVTPELFKKIPFWVQVYGIPPGHLVKPLGERLGKAIANSMGGFLDYDPNYRCKFMRIQVQLDSSRPLLRGKFLKLDKNKENIWVSFRYERLSKFCYFCGFIDNIQKSCVALAEELENGNRPRLQYDESLKTPGLAHGLSSYALSTSLEKKSNNKTIVQMALEASRIRPHDSPNDQPSKRLKTENSKNTGMEMGGVMTNKQVEEGSKKSQANIKNPNQRRESKVSSEVGKWSANCSKLPLGE